MAVTNLTRKTIIASQAIIADTFFSRMIGLLNRTKLSAGEALIITHCNSIHMFFMRFAIDVIFVDKNKKVVGLVNNIKPFMLSKVYWNSSFAVELPVGAIGQSQTQIGDQLVF